MYIRQYVMLDQTTNTTLVRAAYAIFKCIILYSDRVVRTSRYRLLLKKKTVWNYTCVYVVFVTQYYYCFCEDHPV